MAGKLHENGLWESSRMILPEHKEAILRQLDRLDVRERPEIDEQELELMGSRLMQAMYDEEEVSLLIYDEYQDNELTGRVVQVDPYKQRIRLENESSKEWVNIMDILRIN